MSSEFNTAAATIIAVIISRVISHFEHRKTSREVTEIRLSINGEMEKKIAEAKEEGRQEILKRL